MAEKQFAAEQFEWEPTFYVGHHDTSRLYVDEEMLRKAEGSKVRNFASPNLAFHELQAAYISCARNQYDMLTTPITTPSFRSRVFLLASLYASHEISDLPTHNPEILPAAPSIPQIPSLDPTDTPLSPGPFTSQLLAFTSSWIDLCSPDPSISEISRQVLMLEVGYAAFCGVVYVFVPGPRLTRWDGERGRWVSQADGLPRYARAMQDVLALGRSLEVYVVLPMGGEEFGGNGGGGASGLREGGGSAAKGNGKTAAKRQTQEEWPLDQFTRRDFLDELEEEGKVGGSWKADPMSSWDAWNVVRSVCKYHAKLFVALNVPGDLPPLSVQARWRSEPVRVLSLSSETFKPNPAGYPALTSAVQTLVSHFMRLRSPPWFLLSDVGPLPGVASETNGEEEDSLSPLANAFDPTPSEAAQSPGKWTSTKKIVDPTPHLTYIRRLQRRQPPRSRVEHYGAGYQDYLQVPLQPQTDNLESQTYEVFEMDPVKYDQYELAIRLALRDWKAQKKPASGPEGKVVVTVSGAGRGPLVRKALQASQAEAVQIDLWAVEKNPNALVLLQQHNRTDWGGRVHVVQSDMRSWRGPSQPLQSSSNSSDADDDDDSDISLAEPKRMNIDILVSELLGSFGDNELSPECLDGVLHLLNPTHGMSIPRNYTAFMTPIAAPKLHADISQRSSWDATAPETPAVVWLHAIDFLSLVATSPAPSASSSAGSSKVSEKHKNDKTPSKPHGRKSSITATSPPPPHSATPASTTTTTTTSTSQYHAGTELQPSQTHPLVLPTWTFHHSPTTSPPHILEHRQGALFSNAHNTRHSQLKFRTRERGVCHGLAGYFEAELYPGVEISTNPLTMARKSREMISWFPMFFPLKTPLYIPDNSLLVVNIWRKTDDRKVWYEWMVESFAWNLTVGGGKKRVRLGGGEVMSSVKGGCLI
ncbi:methyltransferase protein [Agyrium rufum]|nr:methyltransferase protein [Agyrium rufum]